MDQTRVKSLCQIYDKWLNEFMEDMEKHYSDKRTVIKKRFCE